VLRVREIDELGLVTASEDDLGLTVAVEITSSISSSSIAGSAGSTRGATNADAISALRTLSSMVGLAATTSSRPIRR